jgi:pimeloyl-ACP methyl ester carboxylesterase
MAMYVLVHGSTHSAQAWDLVKAELENKGHTVITPELPIDEPEAGAAFYADVIAAAIPENEEPIVVGHSAAGWFLPLVAVRRRLHRMVFLAAMVPRIGMSFLEQLKAEPGMMNPAWIGKDPREWAVADEFLLHDCPPERLAWAHSTIRVLQLRGLMGERYPLGKWPDVKACSIVGSEDRTISPAWSRQIARQLLGVKPMELLGGHCPYISRPKEMADILMGRLEA